MTNVIVVDDHPLFRIGLKATFRENHPDIRLAGEADCGKALFRLLETTTADVVLLDINLPDMNGVDIARRLREEYPLLKILAISAENTAGVVKSLLDVGIDGFISKRQGGTAELSEAIRTVMSGMEYFGRDISAIIYEVFVSKRKTTAVTHEFTDREKEIILACRDGLLCKEIADRLHISTHTVNAHKNNIFRKLGINNTMEMVQYALKNGIISVES
jgi:DNA-binding NarL/FixJ family response regulator